ncbi:prolyl 4-hydroxylase subunit alpha-1-like [Malaya genurostris]|uniref:prolyl 4-hydroxylase subunit alpha-1-like n=1 Tax=Malaya genurostris TaxID=325434 RepID=UPI0026F3A3C3|nr:prolyl 4-hydroxylase subunit alpha-1-like [Malaya genurostris]
MSHGLSEATGTVWGPISTFSTKTTMAASRRVVTLLVLLGATLQKAKAEEKPGEFYSSLLSMEHLLDSEKTILKRLEQFIRLSEQKIEFLKGQLAKLESDIEDTSKNRIAFLSNPINAFLMMKRLVVDYARMDEYMQSNVGVSLIDNSTILPAYEDYMGVADAIANLQHVYQLDTVELAAGIIRGQSTVRELTADECFSIGAVMGQVKQFKYSAFWLEEGLRRWDLEEKPVVSKQEILNVLSYSLAEEGHYEEAMKRTDQLLEMIPNDVGALQKKEVLEQWLQYVEEHGPKPSTDVDRGLYGALCRGEHQRPVADWSMLRCRYESSKTPFIRIAPFKLEEVSFDPLIEVYHDVLSEEEIENLLYWAKPKIRRSKLGMKEEVSNSRISQNGWLRDGDQPLVRTVTLRTMDISGLDDKGFEALQINNYGIGGHYLPHYDWARQDGDVPPFEKIGLGNRIGTVMYYLSDVEQGGATVFPVLGVGVFPKRGSAIFWYNLHHNGTGDRRTLHGACPVLLGSKWVANKWIHEYHQEFRRPCELHSGIQEQINDT